MHHTYGIENKVFVPERLPFLPPAGGIRLGRPDALDESWHGMKLDHSGVLVKLLLRTLTLNSDRSRFRALVYIPYQSCLATSESFPLLAFGSGTSDPGPDFA